LPSLFKILTVPTVPQHKYGDENLSRDLQKSTTQAQAAKSVADRVNWLKSKMK
jgi:hypothetical protein